MTTATSMARIPPRSASIVSLSESAPCATDSAEATTQPASDPQRRVAKGSASPNTEASDASVPAAARPVT